LEIRARFWGLHIKRRYAEAFWCVELAEVNDPTTLGEERFPSALRLASTALSTGRSGTSRRRP
jgi:hypothetical protein